MNQELVISFDISEVHYPKRQIQIKGKHTPFVELRFGIIATTAHPSPPRLLAQRDESVAVARAAE